jgi:exodeoxyribonuclease VIII
MNVMVDLETLGNGNNSVIISIGAVKFDVLTGVSEDTFYVVVDPSSCVATGLEMDASTVVWWMSQTEDARAVFNDQTRVTLEEALQRFSAWYPEGAALWGNGASFDNTILANAYRKVGVEQPWKFWDDRCYRTLKNMSPPLFHQRMGTHHNALDDAIFQAEHAVKILDALGIYI